MLSFKQVQWYTAFNTAKQLLKTEKDFQRLSPFAFKVNNEVHILQYTREGIQGYKVEIFEEEMMYSSLRPMMDKEGERLYPKHS